MIKFFRHIRRSLIQKNQMGKYFKYAIGEIVLVVIGILIALQINNWNETNSKEAKLNNYLVALKEELNGNIGRLNRAQKRSKNDLERSIRIMTDLNSDAAKSYTSDDLIRVENGTGPIFKVELYSAVYKDLINAGVLENLSDPILKRDIFQIERSLENYDEAFNNAKAIWDNYLLPYYHKHKNVAGIWDSIEDVTLPKLAFKNDLNAFVNNRDYANLLASRARQVANLKVACTYTIKDFEELVSSINTYLKND